MANTKAELVAEIVAYSGEISGATRHIEDITFSLENAEERVATFKSNLADEQAKLERANLLLETTATQLAELQKTEGGR